MVWVYWSWISQTCPDGMFHDIYPYFDYKAYDCQAMADLAEENKLQENPETKKKFNLFVGASVGPEVEDRWASLDM